LLRDKQIDILHSHCYKSDVYGLIPRRFDKMKLVTAIRCYEHDSSARRGRESHRSSAFAHRTRTIEEIYRRLMSVESDAGESDPVTSTQTLTAPR
jgi:hypothetical protein